MRALGFAKRAMEGCEGPKPSHGLILGKHGIVTWGENAREAYERMIEMVTRADDFIAARRKAAAAPPRRSTAGLAQVAPIVRGACSEKEKTVEGAWRRLIAEFRG